MDPAQAVNGAAQILSGYLRQYGSVPLALAAYNAGPGAVAEYGGVPPYPETEQYVSSIMASLGGTYVTPLTPTPPSATAPVGTDGPGDLLAPGAPQGVDGAGSFQQTLLETLGEPASTLQNENQTGTQVPSNERR